MSLNLKDYTYELPEERIAEFPLEKRDASNLLVYRKGNISHRKFRDLPGQLPPDATLFFNNTRVLPARLIFHKKTGARIELFLLEPMRPTADVAGAMVARNDVTWKCMIGNLKKWKSEDLELRLSGRSGAFILTASLEDREEGLVRLRWASDETFSEVVHAAGRVPLPPYIRRDPREEDYERYQTVYARFDGAVAAPTAGLHFTPEVLSELKTGGIQTNELTLHVSAGTFRPITTEDVTAHQMHAEEIIIRRENITAVLDARLRVAVGTTSMRTLESLYWYGAALCEDDSAPFSVAQQAPSLIKAVSLEKSMEAVLNKMDSLKTDYLSGKTEIFLYPGYTFRVCEGLITNFHLPGSTLILLIAAFTGEDWRRIYQEALENGYRFLSYGDSSLLLP